MPFGKVYLVIYNDVAYYKAILGILGIIFWEY